MVAQQGRVLVHLVLHQHGTVAPLNRVHLLLLQVLLTHLLVLNHLTIVPLVSYPGSQRIIFV